MYLLGDYEAILLLSKEMFSDYEKTLTVFKFIFIVSNIVVVESLRAAM